jgi:uncharacterized protein
MITARILLVLAIPIAHGQGLEYIKSNYTKYEFQIPMRDGKKLFTSVYAPKDAKEQYPIMLDRTPYSVAPYGVDNYRTSLAHPRSSPRRASASSTRMSAAAI